MWVKIDDGFYDNGKVIAVGKDARALYLAALCYANKIATRGFVPDYMISQLAAKAEADKPQQAVERLCTIFAPNRSSLWEIVDGGYQIHSEPRWALFPERDTQDCRKLPEYRQWRLAVMGEMSTNAGTAEPRSASCTHTTQSRLPVILKGGLTSLTVSPSVFPATRFCMGGNCDELGQVR